jgi:hypothetical protein
MHDPWLSNLRTHPEFPALKRATHCMDKNSRSILAQAGGKHAGNPNDCFYR